MTAPPESVVGRLRAIHDATAVQPGQSIYTRLAAEEIFSASAEEHAPALLAALEKVWARVQESKGWTAGRNGRYLLATQIESDLAPLFTQPETPPR